MTSEPLLLVVDDEPAVLRVLEMELAARGFRILTAASARDALRVFAEHRPDAVLLDVMMPRVSGLDLLRQLRERSPVPVILLTARDSPREKVRGLELGADDYVVKPFHPDELAARIRAVLRRTRPPEGPRIVRAGSLSVDLERRLAEKDGQPLPLTRTEWQLLQELAASAGRVIHAPELLTRVWGPEYRDDLQYLRVWVSRLRAKIEDDPANPTVIRTLPGIGYLFQADEAEAASGEAAAATD